MDSFDNLNLLKDGKRFKFNVEQCKSLSSYMLDKLSPYTESSAAQFLDKGSWEETYRAVKEAETYLKHCSTDNGWMKWFILTNTGEAFTLHMHDFAWSILCLDLAVGWRMDALDGIFRLQSSLNRINNFAEEMSCLHLEQFGCKFQDYLHLLMACNQTAAKAGPGKKKIKIGVLSFIQRKLLEAIMNECKIESATATSASPQIPPADLIKKRAIGEGSFGAVYEGSWLGYKVAVKDIPIDARDLFDRETTVLAKLQSPFIVQLIGTCIEGSHCSIVMEMVSSSLDKLLMSSGGRAPLALPVAVDIMLQISRGMEYLHSQGIMHMDLKASNVLIEPSAVPEFRKQGYGRVKLCDFGMASLRLSSFRCEDPKGTCYWRAPEAFPFPNEKLLPEIDTLEEYTYKADVYSFAMTCYEILTGKQPFLDVHPKDLYRLIVQGRRPILQPTSCPPVLADFMVKCWETDPSRRPCFAQISCFMRYMKLFILTMNDPRSYGEYLKPPGASLEQEGFDECPADKKLKLITRVLQTIPPQMKRGYNACVLGLMPSLKSEVHSFVFPNMEDYFDRNDILGSTVTVLGKGSFGTTYRAKLPDFSLAINRLSKDSTYVGNKRDFENRLQALGNLKHTNLVSLQAYISSEEETLLVYNYYHNGSLYSRLHTGKRPMTWYDRLHIAVDVASGLKFLHDSGMVHGNVKSSNILLDNEGNACLADSCLAELVGNPSASKKSSGYRAPEEYSSGKVSQESDVYSFGVVLLELVTGKDLSSVSTDLATWIVSIKQERWRVEVFDVSLKSQGYLIRNISGMLRIAILCTAPSGSTFVSTRLTMSHVVKKIVNLKSRLLEQIKEIGITSY